ncbi:nicotinamide N-methyltransferase [Ixodes scapularis]
MGEAPSDVKRGAEEITTRTRNAVRKVIPCDVLDPRVLPEEHWEKFDVVLSCLCLESACPDEDSFRKAAKNVGGLVGDGGLLILCGVLGCREYTVGEVTFPCLYLTQDMVKDALVRAGFQVKLWRCLEESVRSSAIIESAFVVMAEKL